ncbi:UNVERIFIED_CONTAM: hypothetical protein K2H54_044669 [Gekko kuhli]
MQENFLGLVQWACGKVLKRKHVVFMIATAKGEQQKSLRDNTVQRGGTTNFSFSYERKHRPLNILMFCLTYKSSQKLSDLKVLTLTVASVLMMPSAKTH